AARHHRPDRRRRGGRPGQAGGLNMDTPTAVERAAAVELLVLDVDGVLTDGQITYTADGVEVKSFHVRDGSGLVVWRKLGKRTAIVSGRASQAVDMRAAELGISPVVQGAPDKAAALRQVLADAGLRPEQACGVAFGVYARFLGAIDGLPELPDELLARRSGDEPFPPASQTVTERKLALAFGPACEEVRYNYKIELPAKGVVIATNQYELD